MCDLRLIALSVIGFIFVVGGLRAAEGGPQAAGAPAGELNLPSAWEMSSPLIAPETRDQNQAVSVKDPTVVFHEGRWHVFMTIRPEGFTPTEYVSFAKWEEANQSPRTLLRLHDGKYYCAPQVFYFRPQKKWYLVYQAGVPGRKFMHIAYSTTATIADANTWTKADWFLPDEANDPRKEGGLDYWVICDDQRAYLFFTSLNGKLWRTWTKLEDFPRGWGRCEVALQADIFEASHTYRLKGTGKYLTIVEANPGGKRYYKAYLADRLDGVWRPLADSEKKPFAGAANVRPAAGVAPWADNISHGELIRDGIDETMTVDPNDLRLVFQGVLEKEKAGKPYGRIPWRIGVLTPAKE